MSEYIEKLREWAANAVTRDDYMNGLTFDIDRFCDEIEREVEANCIRLPVDADGVTLHIGDMVIEESDRSPCKVMSLILYEDCWDVNSCGMNPNFLHHYHAPTIEDVLRELVNDVRLENIEHSRLSDETLAEYAERVREVLCDEI